MVFMVFCLALHAAPGFSAPQAPPPSDPAIMMKMMQEGPLQAKDISAFLKTNDDLLALKKETLSSKEMDAIFIRNFGSVSRGYYASAKIAMTYEQLENGLKLPEMPGSMQTTPAELELIKKHMPALREGYGKLNP